MQHNWDVEADVVVVGFGAAGVAASVTAHDLGAEVVILEKAPEGEHGGNTRVAGQGYLNTSLAEDAAAYLTALCGPYAVPAKMVRVWAEEMCRNNQWLAGLGGDPQEHQHPPVGIEFPNLPGSDCVHKFHDGPTYGYSYTWKRFESLDKERPLPILYETPAKELIQHDITKEILDARHPVYARMAEEIIDYLDRKLYDPSSGTFYGCEDFLRNDTAASSGETEYLAFLDRCMYTDANAQAIVGYLEAASLLGKRTYQERGLQALEFLWEHCRSAEGGMYHYFDGTPHVPGLLNDQARVGSALVLAHKATGEANYLARAKELAEFILSRMKNPNGGYYDLAVAGPAHLSVPLTLIEQNGAAASFLLALAETELRYQDAALWALSAFTGDFSSYGIHAAAFGRALIEAMKHR